MTDYTDLINELTWFAAQDKDFIDPQDSINTKAAEAIRQLIAERDAAFAMSKCECETNEACKNLVALHEEVTYLEECVSSHEKDKCSAQESFGKCFTENQKLHKEITTLKSMLCETSKALEDLYLEFSRTREWGCLPMELVRAKAALVAIKQVLGEEE